MVVVPFAVLLIMVCFSFRTAGAGFCRDPGGAGFSRVALGASR
jgi:hypothetical protein